MNCNTTHYRANSSSVPGDPTTLTFWRGTGNVFGKGHRIRIEVSSTFFPYYLTNPGTGEDNVGLQTRRVIARQKVLHDAENPSHVVLPTIPPGSRNAPSQEGTRFRP